jgi:hypothetical protein
MQYIRGALAGALAAAGALFVLVACWAVWQVGLTVQAARLSGAVLAGQLGATLQAVNRPCSPVGPPCGTLADLNRTLATARGTLGEVELAARHEDRNLGAIDGQERALFADLHGTLQAAQGAITEARGTLAAASSALVQAGPLLTAGTATLEASTQAVQTSTQTAHDIDARVADPNITLLVQHLNGVSLSADRMLADAQWKEHQLLHPPKKKLGFWATVGAGVLWMHRLLPPLF